MIKSGESYLQCQVTCFTGEGMRRVKINSLEFLSAGKFDSD